MGCPSWQWLRNQSGVCCTGTAFGLTVTNPVHFDWTRCRHAKQCPYECKGKLSVDGSRVIWSVATKERDWTAEGEKIAKEEKTERTALARRPLK